MRDDPRVEDLVHAGRVRAALFVPQFTRDPATGAIRGHGTGYIGIAITRLLAARLGIEAEIMGQPSPHVVEDDLERGEIDLAFLGIEPKRAARFDLGPPMFEFDFALLVPPGSAIRAPADADRKGTRIAVAHGHASTLALGKLMRYAELIGNVLPEEAFEMLRTGRADAFAFPRDVLLELAERLPGSRVLDEAYGVNRATFAIAKGRPGRLAYLAELVEEAKASGLIQQTIESGGLNGFRVAPRAP